MGFQKPSGTITVTLIFAKARFPNITILFRINMIINRGARGTQKVKNNFGRQMIWILVTHL